MTQNGRVKNIVLVHGAWADGSGWRAVYSILKKDGYTVAIVQNPIISLGGDVAATKRTIANLNGPVILVGHSYGGAVITEAGNDPKVAGLVYVAAFVRGKQSPCLRRFSCARAATACDLTPDLRPSITRQGRAAMSKESAQAALGKFAEAVNTGKFNLFDEVVAANCIDHDPADGQVPGPAGYQMFFSGMRTAFPDLSVTPETIVQDEDTIALAYTLTGTHTGPLEKIPPTGKKVKIRGMQISKFKDGKMVERWGSSDERTLLKQIGVIPD